MQEKKTLIIMRHAKSSWDDMSLPDSERPLNKRGKHNAPMMGGRMKKQGCHCDLLISSPAVRALATAKLVAKEIGYKRNISEESDLYMADIGDYLHVISGVDEQIKNLMLVSHNPGIEEFFIYLTGEMIENFPTAAYAIIEVKGKWSELTSGKLLHYDFPKSAIA